MATVSMNVHAVTTWPGKPASHADTAKVTTITTLAHSAPRNNTPAMKKVDSRMLGISIKTVETHRTALMRKIGVKSIVELVRYAVRNNLTEA